MAVDFESTSLNAAMAPRLASRSEAQDERLSWVLEFITRCAKTPLAIKKRVRSVIQGALKSKTNVPQKLRLSLALTDIVDMTEGFESLGPLESGKCADLLDEIRKGAYGDARCVPSGDLVALLRLEWACGHLREGAASTMESPQKRYKMVENFKIRWKTLENQNMFKNERGMSKDVRKAYDLVQKSKSLGEMPDGWEKNVISQEAILQSLKKYCKTAEYALGPSFLSSVQSDISSGVYRTKVDKNLILRGSGVAPVTIQKAIDKSKATRGKLAEETTKHADPLDKTLEASAKFAKLPPRRANITYEPKKNARTMSWESQHDDVMGTPPPPAKKSRLDPLVIVALEEQAKSEGPKSPGTVRLPSGITRVRSPGGEHVQAKKYARWTPAEEQDLIAGVKKYGTGKWAKILRDKEFHIESYRDNVNVKDKWRSLVKKDPSLSKFDKKLSSP